MTLDQIKNVDLEVAYGLNTARLGERPMVERRLADLKECFVDQASYEKNLDAGNPMIYSVSAVEPGQGDGQLHYGLGILMPGKIGSEYYLTKGHLHTYRPAAEVYIGLRGEGAMLLEDEASGQSQMVSLRHNSIVYVPGYTAHRTMNTGSEPLVYIGIYPANAGHDYSSIAKKNFSQVVFEKDGRPAVLPRVEFLKSLA